MKVKTSVTTGSITAFWISILLVVALCFPETRLWNFKTVPSFVADKISYFNTVSVEKKQVVWGYDAPDTAYPLIGDAAKAGVKPLFGKSTSGVAAREAQRQVVATDFYRTTTGWNNAKIAAHLRGIDFSRPVSVVNIPAGTSLTQFNLPGRTGNYFANVGTPANRLGIYTSGLIESRYTFRASTPALRSTAASLVDDWSMSGAGWRIQTDGGEIQYFVPNPNP